MLLPTLLLASLNQDVFEFAETEQRKHLKRAVNEHLAQTPRATKLFAYFHAILESSAQLLRQYSFKN